MKNFEEDGFYNLKYVDGKICGMQDYLFTTAIVVGISENGYARRYCYPKFEDALKAFLIFDSLQNHPEGNWVKVKGSSNDGTSLDEINPNLELES